MGMGRTNRQTTTRMDRQASRQNAAPCLCSCNHYSSRTSWMDMEQESRHTDERAERQGGIFSAWCKNRYAQNEMADAIKPDEDKTGKPILKHYDSMSFETRFTKLNFPLCVQLKSIILQIGQHFDGHIIINIHFFPFRLINCKSHRCLSPRALQSAHSKSFPKSIPFSPGDHSICNRLAKISFLVHAKPAGVFSPKLSRILPQKGAVSSSPAWLKKFEPTVTQKPMAIRRFFIIVIEKYLGKE
ncbi:hypothetical protein AVEN_237854-1 [Araneus ventricosus]|uniref:Uncharacterized protein n=1 Tax=Araneus ventricosus TaxID=182803 RepID=A0A4Y2P267_ARAVE|nr:hypothetical protein AVEN_237854-1 [Araneus ventricosus]